MQYTKGPTFLFTSYPLFIIFQHYMYVGGDGFCFIIPTPHPHPLFVLFLDSFIT